MIWALLLCTAGCANRQPKPIMVSSAGAPGYALSYPERLEAETKLLEGDEQKAKELSEKLGTRRSELKPGADPAILLLIVQRADEDGRSQALAEATDDTRAVRTFWEDERGPIGARAASAAQKQAAEAKCSQTDFGGPVAYALKSGVDTQLEKRLRADSEAQRTIERNKAALGAGNLSAVQKLADDITSASYVVNIEMVEQRNRIDGLLSERARVGSTLSNAIDWERKFQMSSRPAADKKASQERMAALQKSRAALPAALAHGDAARRDLDKRIEAARKSYQEGLEALEKDLEAQQRARAGR